MTQFTQTQSGLLVPATSEGPKRHSDFELYPHARAYAPGGPLHRDPRVKELNQELAAVPQEISGRQVLFAAWHENSDDQRILSCKLHGIVVWALTRDTDRAIVLGNPSATKRLPDGSVHGVDARHLILTWLAETSILPGSLCDALRRAAERHTSYQTKTEKAFKEHAQEVAAATAEACLQIVTADKPSRPDRTVAQTGPGTKEQVARKAKANLPPAKPKGAGY